MFQGVSFDGGAKWTLTLVGSNDNLGDACCNPTLSFDEFGTVFMGTDGGLSFHLVGNVVARRRDADQFGTPILNRKSRSNRRLV